VEFLDDKIKSIHWSIIESKTAPPPGRVGHTMHYLPKLDAFVVVGGRNDSLGPSLPFLDDVWLFLFELKQWVELKNPKLERLCNHCADVFPSGNGEKLVVFGGVKAKGEDQAVLSNSIFVLEFKSGGTGKH